MTNVPGVDPVSRVRYDGHMPDSGPKQTIGDRVQLILDHRKLTGARLAELAGIGRSTPSSLILRFKANPQANYEAKTLAKIADAAKVPLRWLEHGEGEPGWEGESNALELSIEEPGNDGPADAPLHDQPPATMAHTADYAAIEHQARKLSPDSDEWIWKYMRVSNPFRDGRYPITPASLATLAEALSKHGIPPANSVTKKK